MKFFLLAAALALPNFALASSYICADQDGNFAEADLSSDESQVVIDQPGMTVQCSKAEPESLLQTVSYKTRRGHRSYGYSRGSMCWSFYCAECAGGRTRVYPLLFQYCR
jgi:hypothetical protein